MAKDKKSKEEALFLNRELSWIEFNFRVLEQAEDTSLPPLERRLPGPEPESPDASAPDQPRR